MKNKLLIMVTFIVSVFVMMSCENETTAGFTKITYYPTIEVLGESTIFIKKGEDFVDPGVKSILNGEDVSDQVAVQTNLNNTKPGIYNVSYTITNVDGFSAKGTRTVCVADPTPSLLESSVYTVADGTYRLREGLKIAYKGYPIIILQMEPGIFLCTDFLGGYYDKRAGYGPRYAAIGNFKLKSDNTLQLVSSEVAGWGDALSDLVNATYDPSQKKISWNAQYAGMSFFVFLTK